MKLYNLKSYRKMAESQLFLIIIIFITLVFYSKTFLEHSTIINELSLLYSEESNSTVIHLMEILTGLQFQIISRFVTIFFSLYVISFILWFISKLDEVIFSTENKLQLKDFVRAYLYSLYVVIVDLIIQTGYMSISGNEIPLNLLPYYTSFVITFQFFVILYVLGVRKNKLYITTTLSSLVIITIDFLIIYFGGDLI